MGAGADTTEIVTIDETVTIADRLLSVVRPRSGEAQLGDEAFGGEVVLPFWAEMWPSGVALASALSGRSLRGVPTLELGCGALALPSIIAALSGARALATDWSADAVTFARRNARRSRAPVEVELCSWTEPELIESRKPWELVLAADILYEPHHVEILLDLLPRLVDERGSVWIADPGRVPARAFLDRAAERFTVETTGTDVERVLIHRLRPR